MHALYVAAGATNVIWVWDESAGGPTPAEYYPGNDVVDWVGIDNYDRTNITFNANFTPFLNDTSQYKKPTMICETAAISGYQAAYFPQIMSALPQAFPLVKAISFFDSAGGATTGDWSLTPAGIAGFASMGQLPAFGASAASQM